ncbi:CWC16 protein [Absidia repens]|uniref:Splicing factor YJU2 n=1 Tax=Absidia repens TaxID=90262 RepID=A0A1X2IM61_9FUNG|nr:CWC16 protein [Absidia repens]
MSERKVLNKYFPPNFDPAKIPKQTKPKDLQHKVRLMAPFSMRCESCGEYIYKGKKFNARKETVVGEKYLSIQVFRFYIRCPRCSAEITFKTDPQNSDYVAENGVSRNFEPWRGDDGTVVADEDDEEQEDAMASLESRTLDSKREMEIMDALDEIRTRNARSERVSVDDVLDQYSNEVKEQVQQRLTAEEERDNEEAAAAFKSADGATVRKIDPASSLAEQPVDAISLVRQQQQQRLEKNNRMAAGDQEATAAVINGGGAFAKPSAFKRKNDQSSSSSSSPSSPGNKFGIVVKKKKVDSTPIAAKKQNHTQAKPQTNALSMLASYDDDDDSDSD